jgi:replicative DNA helicase
MKQFIIKFLGLDKIQQENAYLINKVDNLSNDLYHRDWSSSINYRELERELDYGRFNIDAEDIADEFSTDDIAREIDHCAVAGELDLYDVAENIDVGELARYIDKDDIASAIDLDDTIAEVLDRHFDGEKMNEFASIVAEKIADRDGMQELVSEEVDNQVNSISADAIQSMIDTAIQQFADSLEVMVSAKLNINK